MPMELNRRELKAQARERMRETRPPFWLLTLVYILLTTGVSTLADLTGAAQFTFPPSSGDTLPLFLYLLILLYTTVMNFGYQIWALRVYRRQQVGYGTLIDGFSMAGQVLLMELYIFGCTLCWALAFGTAGGLALLLMDWLPPVLLVLLFYGAVFGITLWISYRYALAPFLLMDRPEGSKTIYLYRKRMADGEPIVRVETYLPYEECSFVLDHDLNRESLYQVLSTQINTRITHMVRICEARSADGEDEAVLGLKRGRPIHYFQSMGYNRNHKLLELSVARYRGDQSRFRVEVDRE